MSDIEITARKLLEKVAKDGAYTEDDLDFICKQFNRGYMGFQHELRHLLGLED